MSLTQATQEEILEKARRMFGHPIMTIDDIPENHFTRPVSNLLAYQIMCEKHKDNGKSYDVQMIHGFDYCGYTRK